MSRIHFDSRGFQIKNQNEAAALLFENEELRKKATELLLETTILREALSMHRLKPDAAVDGFFKLQR